MKETKQLEKLCTAMYGDPNDRNCCSMVDQVFRGGDRFSKLYAVNQINLNPDILQLIFLLVMFLILLLIPLLIRLLISLLTSLLMPLLILLSIS
jgi:hypothetical protein